METLKNIIQLSALILLISVSGWAQQSDKILQKAFSESYQLEKSKSYAAAIEVLKNVYSESSYEINLRLGWLYHLNNENSNSVTHYQKAVNLRPLAIEAKLGIVKPLSVQEKWDKVLEQYNNILKIDDKNYYANYYAGSIYYYRKNYTQAIKYLEIAVNLYPFDYDGNHLLAWTYLMSGNYQNAKIVFNKALLIRPGDTSCLDGLSKIK